MTAPIVLMTDFGTCDSYVGVMKGVIATIAPSVPVIDLTHEIRPQDVAHGAYTLRIAVPYFPAGSVFCAVVDPGVGSTRCAVALELGDWFFVLPDNGLLTRLLDRWQARCITKLTNQRYQLPQPSTTFHGRDIFAPAAAHLAAGVPLEELGEPLSSDALQRLDLPSTQRESNRISGTIMHIDHFGNLITTIDREDLEYNSDWHIRIEEADITLPRICRTFADLPVGEAVAYIGSDGFLELAVRNGNAAQTWGIGLGAGVVATRGM